MKVLVTKKLRRKYYTFFVLAALFSVAACKPKKKSIAEVRPGKEVMGQFEASPPLVREITSTRLDTPDDMGNNLILRVAFDKAETRLKGINTLPLAIDEKTEIQINDRGIDGDETAGDGIFSLGFKVTGEELAALEKNNLAVLAEQENVLTRFNGRIAFDEQVKAEDFQLTKSKVSKKLEFLFRSSVNSGTLPGIREKSLMITDTSVVEDLQRTYDPCRRNKGNPGGAWSFNSLISNMAGASGATEFLKDWVDSFLFSSSNLPSGDAASVRDNSKARVIRAWMRNSGVPVPGGTGVPAGWRSLALKAEEFPVRLLAIINRLDLRGNSGYGGGFASGGEGRFVFTFTDSNNNCAHGSNGSGTMTFILEYGIPIKSCQGLSEYGRKWWDLKDIPFGQTYNAQLEEITKVFTAQNASPSKPNGSALNHFRTNDFISGPWDIRDFEIATATGKLTIVHPEHESMQLSNGFSNPSNTAKLSALVSFVNSLPFSAGNPAPSYSIPDGIKGIHAPMPGPNYHWKGNADFIIDPFKRRAFSFNTCSGCHTGETRNFFTHVRPRNIGVPAALSGFMTGLGTDDNTADDDASPTGKFWVNDPGPAPQQPQQGFNDALFRAKRLEDLVFNSVCMLRPGLPNRLIAVERALRFRPLNMVH